MKSYRGWMKMNKPKREAVEISRYISSFLKEYAPRQLTNSSHTLKSYETTLSLFIGYLETKKGIQVNGLDEHCFERTSIEDWLVWLAAERGCCPGTCNNRLAAIRAFLKYLSSKNLRFLYLANEAAGIALRKTQKKKVHGMSRNAVKFLLASPDSKSKSGLRDLAFMVFLYATAARLDEALSLQIKHLHLDADKPYAIVVGKGDKVRTLFLLPKVVAHMRRYLQEYHGGTPEPESYVFYSRIAGSHGKMTQAGISKMLKSMREWHMKNAQMSLSTSMLTSFDTPKPHTGLKME